MKLRLYFIGVLFLITGCGDLENPDDGLKFKSELNRINLTLLKDNGYFQIEQGDAYSKAIGDTIIVYTFEKEDVKRIALFKYHGDTSVVGLKRFFANKHFTLLNLNTKNFPFKVYDKTYKKKYIVTYTKSPALCFEYCP